MKRLQKVSIVIDLIKKLREKGSWCGETHIQKAIYFLQELTGVPLEFEFILYKHGPFSFDLRDELTAMRSDGLIERDVPPYPYGPGLFPTESGENIKNHFPRTVREYRDQTEFIADNLGDKSVVELERLGTALLVTKKYGELDQEKRADIIHQLKAHVPVHQALLAVRQVDQMRKVLESKA